MKFKVLTVLVTVVAVLGLSAQEKKDAAKKAPAKSAILHPEMTVSTGSWDHPAATIGTKPTEPWTTTSVAAGVDSKPQPGKPVTVIGEIVDFSCYLQVGKHGDKHRDCAQKCFRNGQPIGLLTEDGGLYMLMEEEHDPRRDGMGVFRQAAIDHAGHIMEVTGTASSVNGFNALYVRGFLKK